MCCSRFDGVCVCGARSHVHVYVHMCARLCARAEAGATSSLTCVLPAWCCSTSCLLRGPVWELEGVVTGKLRVISPLTHVTGKLRATSPISHNQGSERESRKTPPLALHGLITRSQLQYQISNFRAFSWLLLSPTLSRARNPLPPPGNSCVSTWGVRLRWTTWRSATKETHSN